MKQDEKIKCKPGHLVPSYEIRPEVKYKIDNNLDITEEERETFTYGEFLYLGVED